MTTIVISSENFWFVDVGREVGIQMNSCGRVVGEMLWPRIEFSKVISSEAKSIVHSKRANLT